MPYKDPEENKACKARYYQKHKEKYDKKNKQWIKDHPDEFRAIQKKYLATEKGKQATHKKQKKFQGSKKDKIRHRKCNLKRMYGLTLEDYDQMFEQQNGVCAVCGGLATGGKRLVVDHCHITGKIRGLLCGNCNIGIGNMQDNVDILAQAIIYLNKYIEPA